MNQVNVMTSFTTGLKRIGVTSQNFRTITGHAGKTRRFLVFTESESGEWRESDRIDLPKEMSMHEFRGGNHPLDALDVIITASCGGGFMRKMKHRNVDVLTTGETDPRLAVDMVVKGVALPPAEPHEH